jgi:Holliday junction resolvase RusA-like endonuclease
MKIIIPGDPISQKRHRHVTRGSFQAVYNPNEKEKEEVRRFLRLHLVNQMMHPDNEIAKEASNLPKGAFYTVSLSFYMPVPKTDVYMARNAKLWQLETCVKDLDNMEKFYLDACNEILYPDDHLITSLSSWKTYSLNPRTEITVMRKDLPLLSKAEKSILYGMPPDTLQHLIKDICNFYPRFSVFCETEGDLMSKLGGIAQDVMDFAQKYGDELKRVKTKSLKE